MNISPALTGVFNGDKRYQVSMRDQWRSVPVPWFTFTAGYDQKIYPSKANNHFFAAGVFFNYDQQGDSNLNLSNVNISGSYSHILSPKNILSIGALLGYSTRGFNKETLTWDKQWNGTNFDASLFTGETLESTRYNFVESAIGLNYIYQHSSRTNLKLGASVFHLIGYDPDFNEGSNDLDRLPLRQTAYAIGTFKLNSKLDFQGDVLYQLQNSYSELILGGYLNIYLNQRRGKTTNLHIGAGYRTSQSWYPKIALQYNNLMVAMSYDIDVSEFSYYTDNKGGPEIHLNYIITNVKPRKNFKICPIF